MMTGAGTTEDPYIVDTIEDFRAAIAKVCDYVKLDADLDCSDLDYWNGVTTWAKTIDLCGHMIKNVNINPSANRYFLKPNTDDSTDCTIKNGTIQSLYCTNLDSIIDYKNYYGTIYLTDLKISGEFVMSNSSNALFYAGYIRFTRCSINVKINGYLTAFYAGRNYVADYEYCNINLDAKKCGSDIFGGVPAHSKFTGKLTYSAYSTSYLFKGGGADNVIAMELISAISSAKFAFSSSNPTGYSILDNDLASQASWVSKQESYVKYLTTAQMKSAEYLNSIGFPVSEV